MADSRKSSELSSRYDPAALEGALYERWVDAGFFHVPAAAAKRPYVIVIPPPNVTAALHMGHGLNNTIQDVLVRRRRMQGFDVLWVPGTDHAGIATQNVVERQLRAEGLTRFDLGREAFVERVWKWVGEYGDRIIGQLRQIGCSCDWERTRFTLDEGLSKAVREVFVRLHEKDLVYRGRYIINWCPRCQTALSNEESEHRDSGGKLYRIRYPLVGGGDVADGRDVIGGGDVVGGGDVTDGEEVEVVTTRPETMLGDTGLAVHPEDDRYRSLVGREAELPLAGRRIPVVADSLVDPDFGSGVVKVTPAHDPNDFEIGRRHGLAVLDVMTDAARMNDAVPLAYRGLDRFEARARIVADLEAGGFLVDAKEHMHSVGHCYRCDTVVEPRASLQWFVRMKPLARPGVAAYEKSELRFHPERYGRVYQSWMENIRDWCISRQLWWGHRIPVWYCAAPDCGEVTVAVDDPDECPACGGALQQDEDVLDTWFSSWLWPLSTLGWPEQTEDLAAFYPTDTLVTAPEILFFWVARMIMAGQEFAGELPFTDVLLNGTVRDGRGRRMSKSLGNGIDPLEVVGKYGADAMRFTLIRGSPLGTDIRLDHENLEAAFSPGRNFANKMWNAARFALPHARGDVSENDPPRAALADRWIRSRLARFARDADSAYEAFRLHEVAESGHNFVWGDFCDWYLELSKRRLYGEGDDARDAGRTLTLAMRGWLSILHPIMPFVTEEIAGRLPDALSGRSLVTGPWPDYPDEWIDREAEGAIGALQEFVGAVRALRAECRLPQGARIAVQLRDPSCALRMALAEEADSAAKLAGLSSVEGLDGDSRPGDVRTGGGPAGAHAVLRTGGELFIPLEGLIDVDKERARLFAELERVDGLLSRSGAKLDNAGFIENAPAEVVERERSKLSSLKEQRARLGEKLQWLDPSA